VSGHEQGVGQRPAIVSPVTDVTGLTDDAFRRLFEVSYRPLLAYARRRVTSPSDADDLVAEVFAVAWRRRDEIPTSRPPLPWLYAVAGNVLRNQRRSDHRRLRLVGHLQTQRPPADAGAADPADQYGDELRAALSSLPFDDQEVLRLVAWEGLSHAEVGQVLGCTANAVGIRVHRARQRLADQLGPPSSPSPSRSPKDPT
jgi:RNA polymerase sigma-70 factor (ECF subfamily)